MTRKVPVIMGRFDLPDNPALRDLAYRQDGILASYQLDDAGLSPNSARARVVAGRWQQLHRRVYAAFSGELDRSGAIWAALLRCGSDAVASHETAAELDGLCGQVDDRVHVTVEGDRRVRGPLAGIRVHYANRLPLTRHPAKSPPRTRLEDTVLDLVDTSSTARSATAWIITAIQQHQTTPLRLADRLASRKKIKWRAVSEAMLVDAARGAHSMLEVEHLRRVERAHGLPLGTRQRRVSGERVIWIDVDYEQFATRIELDGRVGHDDAVSAFRDRKRDNRGTVGRQWTLRYGYSEVFGTPCLVAAEQAFVLQQRGWPEQPRPCGNNCALPTAIMKHRRAS